MSNSKGLLAAVAALALGVNAQAAEIEVIPPAPPMPGFVAVSGDFVDGDADVWDAKTAPLSGRYFVLLNSNGGNLLVGIRIGESVRMRNWTTFVTERCFSSCALAFLGGTTRGVMATAYVGFHAAARAGVESGVANALVGTYLAKLGYSYETTAFVTKAGPTEITYLTLANRQEAGIGYDVVPDEKQAQQAPAQPAQPQPPIAQAPTTGPDWWRDTSLKAGYRAVKTWDVQTKDGHTFRYLLMAGAGSFRVSTWDETGGGSSCEFTPSPAWSTCTSTAGERYQLQRGTISNWTKMAAEAEFGGAR